MMKYSISSGRNPDVKCLCCRKLYLQFRGRIDRVECKKWAHNSCIKIDGLDDEEYMRIS